MKKLLHKKIYLALMLGLLVGLSGYMIQHQGWLTGAKAPPSHGVGGSQVTTQDQDADMAATVIQGQTDPKQVTAAAEKDAAADNDANANVATNSAPASTEATGNLSNKTHGWGIKPNKEHRRPEMPSAIDATLNKYGAYWVGSQSEKILYLTFDEGYENGYTPKILDILKENNVPAAFFVTGHFLKSQPELVKRMADEGHIVGNHTDTHPSLPDVSDVQIKKELQAVETAYAEITGLKNMCYLRPPKGEYSERSLFTTKELGYHNIFWSLAMVDWVPMPGGPEQAYQGVMDHLHPGAIILLHAVSKDNTEALDKILKDAKAQGYEFKTLDDLVGKSSTES